MSVDEAASEEQRQSSCGSRARSSRGSRVADQMDPPYSIAEDELDGKNSEYVPTGKESMPDELVGIEISPDLAKMLSALSEP